MKKRRAGPKTTLFYAIAMTLIAIGFFVTKQDVPAWGALLFVVLAGHSWWQFFGMISKK